MSGAALVGDDAALERAGRPAFVKAAREEGTWTVADIGASLVNFNQGRT